MSIIPFFYFFSFLFFFLFFFSNLICSPLRPTNRQHLLQPCLLPSRPRTHASTLAPAPPSTPVHAQHRIYAQSPTPAPLSTASHPHAVSARPCAAVSVARLRLVSSRVGGLCLRRSPGRGARLRLFLPARARTPPQGQRRPWPHVGATSARRTRWELVFSALFLSPRLFQRDSRSSSLGALPFFGVWRREPENCFGSR